MDRNKIIIIAVIVIIIGLFIGFTVTMETPSKKASRIVITSNSTLKVGDDITVRLTDLKGEPIKNETVNITLFGKDGSINYNSVITDKNGIGTLKIEKSPGKYTNNATFSGNDEYAGNNTSQKFIIEETINNPTF